MSAETKMPAGQVEVEMLDDMLSEVGAGDMMAVARENDWRRAGDGDDWLNEICADLVDAYVDEAVGVGADDLRDLVDTHRPMLRQRLDAAIDAYANAPCECTGGASWCSTCRTYNE